MNRVVVITGAASGIGAATATYLRERSVRVITSDLRGADVTANLATSEGRTAFVEGVARQSGGKIDAVIANAGGGPVETSVQLNFFGAVATLAGLRPLLAGSIAPRAVAVSSIGSLFATRSDLVEACLAGDEPAALVVAQDVRAEAERAGADTARVRETVYGHAKLALNRWCRAAASSPDWAGAGIPLNVVALGVYDTPVGREALREGGAPGDREHRRVRRRRPVQRTRRRAELGQAPPHPDARLQSRCDARHVRWHGRHRRPDADARGAVR